MSKCGKGVNIVAVSAYYGAPRLQVTEAYYRTPASAAGSRRADRQPRGVGTVPPAPGRGQPAGISLSPGGQWMTLKGSQNWAGQRTSQAGEGRRGGRKKSRCCKGSGEDCLGNAAHFHLECNPAERPWSSGLLAPGPCRKFLKEPPGTTSLRIIQFPQPCAQGTELRRNLWKVPERSVIQVLTTTTKKDWVFSSMPLALRRSAGCGGWMTSAQLAVAEAEAAAFLV